MRLCDTAELPHLEHREMQSLSAEQAARLLTAAKDDRLGVVFAFALLTDARPVEVFALKWSDIDFERATVTIQRTLQWRKKRKDSEARQAKKTPPAVGTSKSPNAPDVPCLCPLGWCSN